MVDVVVESSPPGYMNGLGLSYEQLKAVNRSIILTSITPFGQDGPYRDFQASDLVLMAMGGAMFSVGDPDRPPVRVSIPQAYLHGGIHAAVGTLLALYHKTATAEGQHVDVSIQAAVARILIWEPSLWAHSQFLTPRDGPFHYPVAGKRFRQVWPCKNGYVSMRVMGARYARTLKALVEWMNSEGMAGSLVEINWDGFDVRALPNIQEVEEVFLRFFRQRTKEELASQAMKRGFSLVPVQNPSEISTDEQLQARQFLVNLEHPELGTKLMYPGIPCKLSEPLWSLRTRAPLVGEHNEQVYCGLLGLSQHELCIMREADVI